MLVEFTKEFTDSLNKTNSKAFVVSYLFPTFKYLIFGCSNYEMSGPLMEKLKIAVNYNSINNLDVVFQFADHSLKFACASRLNLLKLKLT